MGVKTEDIAGQWLGALLAIQCPKTLTLLILAQKYNFQFFIEAKKY